MGDTRIILDGPSQLMRIILAWLANGWLAILFDLYHSLRHILSLKQQQGMYEILDYDSTLEILDAKGETAIFRKRQKAKFLQDNILAFQDYAWGEGDIFKHYTCSPGTVVDCYQEGDRWNILISLRATKGRGDTEDFYIQRTVKHGFTKAEEWRQVEIRHRTRRLRLAVIFPKSRHCRKADLLQRSRNRLTPLGQEYRHELPDGRQVLAWQTQDIDPLEIYTLRWQW